MCDDAAKCNEVVCGGACGIKVVYTVDHINVVGPEFVPAGTGNMRCLEEVVFDLVVVATRGVAILLPEPMEEFRGFQQRVR